MARAPKSFGVLTGKFSSGDLFFFPVADLLIPTVTQLTVQILHRQWAIRLLKDSAQWLVLFAFLFLLTGPVLAADNGIKFDIEQQRADRALTLFARTAQISVLFPSREIRDRLANPLVGTYTVDQGLEIMLGGTGLSAVRDESGQLIVEIVGAPEENLVMNISPKGNTRSFGAVVAGFVGSVFAASATVPAIAQESGASSGTLVEITVTARKRAESLQDVPVTITAFNEDTIEQAGIYSMRDYVGLTSNMNLVETQNTQFAFVNIRGLSTVRNVDPTVAVVIDGVLSTTSLGFSQDFYDVEQIEVLKGPQGALYGRNATGGAINITTRRPTEETEGFIRASYGNGNNKFIAGSLSGGLSDTLLGNAVISYREADGWRDNVNLNVPADPYEDLTARGRLIWNPSEAVSVDLRAYYSNTEAGGSGFSSNAPNFVDAGFPALAHLPGNGSTTPVPGLPAPLTPLIGDPNNTSVQPQGNNPVGQDDREAKVFSMKIDWETEIGTITSTTSYDELDAITVGEQFPYSPFVQSSADPTAGTRDDAVVLPPPVAGPLGGLNATFGQNRFHSAFSQELRITSPDDQRLRWIAGGYFVDSDLDTMISIQNDTGQGFVPQTTNPNIGGINPTRPWNAQYLGVVVPAVGFPAAIASLPNRNPGALAYNFDTLSSTVYAVFGQLNYDINDQFELSFALRYDRDEREIRINTAQQFLPVFDFPSGREGDVRANDYDSLQPKLTLRWKPSDDITIFGIYSQGFRSGGFNLSGVAAGVGALTAAGVPGLPNGVQDSFDQEDTESFELGFKGTFADGTLSIGASAFYTQIDNAFTFTFVAPFTAQTIRNVEEAESSGLEISATWLATENFQVDAGLGLLDSEIKKVAWRGAAGIDVTGNKLPYAPDSQFNIGFTFNQEINNDWGGYLRVDYQRVGEMFFETENFAPRDSIDLINARLGIGNASGWEVALWGRNLGDEEYAADVANPNGIYFFAKPRQYGVEITKRF